jgi:hypothetical protein
MEGLKVRESMEGKVAPDMAKVEETGAESVKGVDVPDAETGRVVTPAPPVDDTTALLPAEIAVEVKEGSDNVSTPPEQGDALMAEAVKA